jgi:hypothetical protein
MDLDTDLESNSVWSRYIPLLLIALVLSAFTHLWNPIGYPFFHLDETHYMRRALHVIENRGNPQITSLVAHPYDHPYFGWIFLAGVLHAVGYPDSLHPSSSGDIESIEKLHLVPRLIMGILGVTDTFLIYKIAERRYNRTVAFVASILFAVSPLVGLTRGIFLDTIMLPFLLASILFALYSRNPEITNKIKNLNHNYNKANLIMGNNFAIMISGVFLGLSIFTKIPAFTMIPLVGYLIYTESNRNLKALVMWFIPVILIPAIWPAHAIYSGDLDSWKDDILWQATERPNQSIFYSIEYFFRSDPILLVLGFTGLIFAAIRKDINMLLWATPFLIFLCLIGYVAYFHLNPLFPLFCIAASIIVVELLHKITIAKNVRLKVLLPLGTGVAIAVSQLITTIPLVTMDENSLYLKTVAILDSVIPDNIQISSDSRNKITVIGAPKYFWTAQSLFDKDRNDFNAHSSAKLVRTDKVVLIIDGAMVDSMQKNNKVGEYLRSLYNNSKLITTIEGEYGENQYGQVQFRMADT